MSHAERLGGNIFVFLKVDENNILADKDEDESLVRQQVLETFFFWRLLLISGCTQAAEHNVMCI